MAPPSNPYLVIKSSPLTVCPAQVTARFFRGLPSATLKNSGDQSYSQPTLEGEKGLMRTPMFANCSAQFPSEPVCGQEAPPSAKTTADAFTGENSCPF